jgi:hypothetical protein
MLAFKGLIQCEVSVRARHRVVLIYHFLSFEKRDTEVVLSIIYFSSKDAIAAARAAAVTYMYPLSALPLEQVHATRSRPR